MLFDAPEIPFSEAFEIINRFSVDSGRRMIWKLRADKRCSIYFAHSGELNLVKIGMSSSVPSRIVSVSRKHQISKTLVVITDALVGAESSIQAMMKNDRSIVDDQREREWFRPSTELVHLIQRLSGDTTCVRVALPRGRPPKFRFSWLQEN